MNAGVPVLALIAAVAAAGGGSDGDHERVREFRASVSLDADQLERRRKRVESMDPADLDLDEAAADLYELRRLGDYFLAEYDEFGTSDLIRGRDALAHAYMGLLVRKSLRR